MFKKIVVPYDKSETAQGALLKAIEFAKEDPNTVIDIINITPLPQTHLPSGYSAELLSAEPVVMDSEDYKAYRSNALRNVTEDINASIGDRINELGERASVKIVPGVSPVDEIINYANENNCDLICMGCRGLGALRGMLGSVSYGVLRSSAVPVLVVK